MENVVRLLSIAFLAFLFGFIAQRFQLFPSEQLNAAINQATAQFSEKKSLLTHYLQTAHYDRHGTQVLDARASQPGLTLITSYWADMGWKAGIKLIDTEGRIMHQWKTDVVELWPDAPEPVRLLGGYVHGSYLFENGDVLFNIEHTGLFMIDSCGALKWHLNHPTHHSIARDSEGNFWVPGNVKLSKGAPDDMKHLGQFPGLTPTARSPVYEDRLLKVSPQGEVLADISLLKVLYENDLQRYIAKISKRRNGDVLHLNNIDVLNESQAAQYPLFSAGDIVVSLRHLHMVFVMDPLAGIVKWHSTDPWIEQHDPDFTGDGWITVFDNNKDFSHSTGAQRGKMLGGSRVVAVQPHTGKMRVIYPNKDTNLFYTKLGGKLQKMENGNLLITETKAGRVFEVTSAGDLVWEWINHPNDKNQVAEVMEGTRYAISPEQVAAWPCHSSS